jgi:hypothetical protein
MILLGAERDAEMERRTSVTRAPAETDRRARSDDGGHESARDNLISRQRAISL